MENLIKLTQTVQKGGCAAKVAATELRQILKKVKFPPQTKDVLVDGSLMDDAAIIKVTNEIALVQTLDFFTPIVDTPYVFGQIAAANSLSDVYAMGGKPQTTMAVLAFPVAQFSHEIVADILQGASDKIAEAKANFVGGHSIDDDTLKFGLSVTGYVHPEKIWKNSGAQENDVLILTKPLGTGTATAALKRGEVSEKEISGEISSMITLNEILDLLSTEQADAIHAATDITGFGLAGHAVQMARASEKNFQIQFQNIPRFEKTLQFLDSGFLTKAHRTNKEYVQSEIDAAALKPTEQQLLYDPQTSGGLLLSVSTDNAEAILKALQKKHSYAKIIGSVKKEIGTTRLSMIS